MLPPPRLFAPWLRRFHRPARLLPGREAAAHVGDRPQPHALHGLGGERRAQAAGAEEDEALVLHEDRLVIGTLRIDPEFQEPARTMEGARHPALAVALADGADGAQDDARPALQ